MTSSIDTNVLVAFLDLQIDVKEVAKRVIEAARSKGDLLISGCVFAELLAGPQRTVADVEATFKR
jgi:predicted nucleic acid-binding protein